jgi:hypothetical protein
MKGEYWAQIWHNGHSTTEFLLKFNSSISKICYIPHTVLIFTYFLQMFPSYSSLVQIFKKRKLPGL